MNELLELIKKDMECKTYQDFYNYDVGLMTFIVEKCGGGEAAWHLFKKLYEDPDGHLIKEDTGVKCTVDGLLSVNRICKHEGFGDDFVTAFRKYRKTPIIFFPCEVGGINSSRGVSPVLNDRIDWTLFDIKRKCESAENCVLESAYNRPRTKKWFEYFKYNFDKIVDWLGIRGVFVNDEGEVYDLECSDGTTLEEIYGNSSEWSDVYYNNVKKKIEEFEGTIPVIIEC